MRNDNTLSKSMNVESIQTLKQTEQVKQKLRQKQQEFTNFNNMYIASPSVKTNMIAKRFAINQSMALPKGYIRRKLLND